MSGGGIHVYLDIDGVLNAITRAADPGWGWSDSAVTKVRGFPINYSPEMVGRLNDLAERVTFHWLTTWREHARELAAAVGLDGGAWPVLDAPDTFTAKSWWKLTAIRDHVAETSPELSFWIDDDLSFDDGANEWLRGRDDVVAVSPQSEVGLTRRALDLIDAAIAEHTEATA